MRLKRAIVTTFDGDPFLLHFWLHLYKKYWGGEVDKVYLSIAHHPLHSTAEIVDYENGLLSHFHKILYFPYFHPTNPETRNQFLIPKVREGLLGLIESDGFIFGKGIVNDCFNKVEKQKYDIVASDYQVIPPPLADSLGRGWARNFFFCRTKYFKSIDMDFMPREDMGVAFDCFGWICAQIANKHPRVYEIPSNMLHPDSTYSPELYSAYKWLHVRQMGSSMLGLGNGEDYRAIRDNNEEKMNYFLGQVNSVNNRWVFTKTAAFKTLIWKYFPDKDKIPNFSGEYERVLNTFIDKTGIRGDVDKMVDYFENIIKP